ncbi:dihydroorotate dehydrogenase [Patescibacteria group bacterium]|nr:MAG: dihydroorotate dehydrogenase [Patescibacteria group bacterium]
MKRYKFSEVKVISCREIRPESGIFRLKFAWSINAQPGQFMLLHPGLAISTRSVMPRPFSIYDHDGWSVTILLKVVGLNTAAYSKLKKGDKVNVSGPHGQPFRPSLHYDGYLLVSGGIGTPALLPFAKYLGHLRKKQSLLVGCRDRSSLIDTRDFRRCNCQTKTILEKEGRCSGLVTDLLKKELAGVGDYRRLIIACGPKAMLKAVAEIAAQHHQHCEVMLEEIMACGVGSCKGCAIFGTHGHVRHVCTDGPAFDAQWIDWNKLVPTPLPQNHSKGSSHVNMSTVLKGQQGRELVLSGPVMNASGCLSVEAIECGQVDISLAGALVSKGVMLDQQFGNPTPRTCETPNGMLNSIGLENSGVDKFISLELPRWLEHHKPVVVNISGHSVEGYATVAEHLAQTKVAAYEINVSCPNIKQGGGIFGLDPMKTFNVVQGVRQAAPNKFLIVKLSPMASDIVAIARAAVAAGADALSLINTPLGMAIDVRTRRPLLGKLVGGLSGPAIHPLAVRMVYQVYTADLGVPIIGMGGINNGWTAAETMLAGATAVATGTALFSDPSAMTKIHDGLEAISCHHRFNHIWEMVGQVAV